MLERGFFKVHFTQVEGRIHTLATCDLVSQPRDVHFQNLGPSYLVVASGLYLPPSLAWFIYLTLMELERCYIQCTILAYWISVIVAV